MTRGVIKSFGTGDTRAQVLRGVEFDAQAGEMTFLVGPSGCGKTTLISILSAMLTPDGGDVTVFGVEPVKLRGAKLTDFRMRTVGFVFQQFNLMPALDAAENAAVPLIVQGVGAGRARKQAAALLDRLGLGAHLDKYPAQLSAGQQQRVAIARALIHEPRLVVCDEPTASLDATSGRAVMEILKSIAVQKNRAVIVVTHDNRIYSFADRITFMADGRVVRTALPASLQEYEVA
ncbi:MAG: ABC transporter ATP-binding protein [Alphaproteobacteria bacterium]|nr:ABC transporter ATP-binding protein [Alphaproteobacteria bacterium]